MAIIHEESEGRFVPFNSLLSFVPFSVSISPNDGDDDDDDEDDDDDDDGGGGGEMIS